MNNYRIDRIQKHPNHPEHTYSIPCGMNSIVFLDTKPPHPSFFTKTKKKDSECFILSKWNDALCTFKVIAVYS